MKKSTILFLIWYLIQGSLFGDQQAKTWSLVIESPSKETGVAIRKTRDGGFIVAGRNAEDNQGLALKLTAEGKIEWKQALENVRLGSLRQLVGNDGFVGNTHHGLVKLDAVGNTVSHQVFRGVTRAVTRTLDGGVIAAFESGNVAKLDRTGRVEWHRNYSACKDFPLTPQSIAATSDGGFLLAGSYACTKPNEAIFLYRIDGSGQVLWNLLYATPITIRFRSISLSKDGTILLLFDTRYGPGGRVIVKLDSKGQELFRKTFEPSGLRLVSIEETIDGGYILLHRYGLIKLNSQGKTLWSKRYRIGRDIILYSMVEAKDQGFVMTGRLSNVKDLAVLKVDSNGGIGTPCVHILDWNILRPASFPLLRSETQIDVRDVLESIVDQAVTTGRFDGTASECD